MDRERKRADDKETDRNKERRDSSMKLHSLDISSEDQMAGAEIGKMKRTGDSFEGNLIRSSSPSNIAQMETIETMPTSDGGSLKITRSVKEIIGACPTIGANEAVGRQVRERREHVSNDVHTFTDIKSESIEAEDGTKLRRTSQTARVKYSTGGRLSASSLMSDPFAGISASGSSSRDQTSQGDYRDRFPLFIPFFEPSHMTTAMYHPITAFETKSITSSSQMQSSSQMGRHYEQQAEHYRHQFVGGPPNSLYHYSPSIKEIVPPTFAYELEHLTVRKGETALFKGTINGSFPFETIWYLDNCEIRSNRHYEISMRKDYSETCLTGLIDYIISLQINDCSYRDIGKYTALVRNEAGNASCSAFLIIEGTVLESPFYILGIQCTLLSNQLY